MSKMSTCGGAGHPWARGTAVLSNMEDPMFKMSTAAAAILAVGLLGLACSGSGLKKSADGGAGKGGQTGSIGPATTGGAGDSGGSAATRGADASVVGGSDAAACFSLFHACAKESDCCAPNRCLNITGTLACEQEGPAVGGSTATGGSSGTGGTGGASASRSGNSCYDSSGTIATTAKTCTLASDCRQAVQPTCCGAISEVGLARSSSCTFPSLSCGNLDCASFTYQLAEDGNNAAQGGFIALDCVSGQCKTLVLAGNAGADAGPCPTGQNWCPGCTPGTGLCLAVCGAVACPPPDAGTSDASSASCGHVTTQAECDTRSDCHSVFLPGTTCGCTAAGCCELFNWCADGSRANCSGNVFCNMAAPSCEAPYVPSGSICWDGCVLQSECAGADAAVGATGTDGGTAKDGSAPACPTIGLTATETSIGTSTGVALLGWTDVSARRYDVLYFTSTSTLMTIATTTATTYTTTYGHGLGQTFFIAATIGTCSVSSNDARFP